MKTIFVIVLAAVSIAAAATTAAELPTAPFRKEHADVKEHLRHLDAMVGRLPAATPDERSAIMKRVAAFLDEHIRAHAEWEEARLYPAVDRRTHSGLPPFTASMRHEHRIIGRWIDELSAIAASPEADATRFARGADRLLGLISAHFEEEEEVLLPILDATMTAAEFEEELGGGAEHRGEEHDHR